MNEQVREYAFGRQDVSKYKRLLESSRNDDGSWVNINWQVPKKFIRHFRTKILKKFRQSIKNYAMVNRIKNI